MIDYVADISIDDYIYRKEITVTETGGEDRTGFPVKLSFFPSNFNFGLARSDGYDVRVAEGSNGTRVLNTWISAWDVGEEIGIVWLKIPNLLAYEVKTLYVYWGNINAIDVSDVTEIGFIFADGFDETPSTNWDISGSYSMNDSKIVLETNAFIESKGTPLSGQLNWVIEEGVYIDTVGASTTATCHRYRFYGTENDFGFNFYREGDTDRTHSVVDSSTYVTYNGIGRGVDASGYSENYIGYKESTDKVYQGMAKRPNLSDYDDNWERQVYGDTRTTYFRIYGRSSSEAHKLGIDWIVVREYFDIAPYSFDTSNLYVSYETVGHETIDWTPYGDDVTNINFLHTSSSGGDPYKLSDNISGAISNCWYSDENAISGTELIIDFGRGLESNNLVSTEYIHYDDSHTGYYNASKLSNSNDDEYFQGTTTSGYVCIDLGNDNIELGCLSVKARSGSLTGMVKNFTFLGGYKDPRFSVDSDWTTLYSGTFQQESVWQPIYFTNENPYKYYKLDIINTYGSNSVLQEWKMYKYEPSYRKMIVSQLRLNPVAFDSQEIYFPKQVALQASNNMVDWTTLLSTTNTATPFYDYVWNRWQRFSFTNIVGYYNYKLICYGNWNNNTGLIAIAEWEMVEKVSEAYIYRILSGDSNNFSSIWASSITTFDNGFIYIGEGDTLNTVYNNRLMGFTVVSGIVDINLI